MKTFAEKNWGDCSKAVAYQLNFVKFCYCNDMYDDFWKGDCPHCDIKKTQFRNYEYPKSSIPKKKDYFQTDINHDMVVKQELMELMLEFYTNNGSRLQLGIFKAEAIAKTVEEYMKYKGFNHKNSVFIADKSCYIDKDQKQVFVLNIWNKDNYPKWDDELNEYDLESAIPNDIAIFRNPTIAQKYLDEYKTNVDNEVKFYFEESLVDIKYWLCDII